MLLKSISAMAFSQLAVQGLQLLSLPLLLRLVIPADYGLFVAISICLTFLLPLASFGLPSALATSQSRRERRALQQTAFWPGWLLSLLLSLLSFAASWLHLLSPFYVALPLALSGALCCALQQQALLQAGKAALLARRELEFALLFTCVKLALVWQYPNALTLVALFAASYWLQAFWLGWRWPGLRPYGYPLPRAFSWLWRRYRHYILYQTPQQVLNALSLALPVLGLSLAFGSEQVAYYSLAASILLLPASLVGKACGDLYLVKLAENHRQGINLWPLLKQFLQVALPLALLLAVLLTLTLPTLLELLFGPRWLLAATYGQLLLPWCMLVLLNAPFLKVFIVCKAQRQAFWLNVFTFAFRAATLIFALNQLVSVSGFVTLFMLTGVLHNLIVIWLAIQLSRQQ